MSNKTPKDVSAKIASGPKRILAGLLALSAWALVAYFVGMLIAIALIWGFLRLQDDKATTSQPCTTNPNLSIKQLTVGDTVLYAEVAEEYADKYKGLSDRNCLSDNTAMLFPYGTSGEYCFVMRDMNFPIDMVWLDENKKVVTIKHDAQPGTYPAEIYCPEGPAQYIVEMQAGYARKLGLKTGAQFSF